MLERLDYSGERIFEVELSKDKLHLELREACDLYFHMELTRKEVIQLANDFLEFASQMVDDVKL